MSVQAVEVLSSDAEHDMPKETAAELDKGLTSMVDPKLEIASRIGDAPGGVWSIGGANWR